jgi:nucleoredoxin
VPRPLSDLLAGDVINGAGVATPLATAVAGKTFGLYFSASWCGPCQRFTPMLTEVYNQLKTGTGDFEVIFVSSDRDDKSFNTYFHKMPWLAIPFADQARIKALGSHFELEGIPSLVIIGPDMQVINKEAVSAVSAEPSGFPWAPKPLSDLSTGPESGGFDINTKPSLIVFAENSDDEEQAVITATLLQIALEFQEEGKTLEDGPKAIFFTNTTMSGVGEQIRTLTKIGDVSSSTHPVMVLLDIPDNGGFYTFAGADITEESVRGFLADWAAGRLTRKQLSRG